MELTGATGNKETTHTYGKVGVGQVMHLDEDAPAVAWKHLFYCMYLN